MSLQANAETLDLAKPLEEAVEEIADRLTGDHANMEILYTAAKILLAFNDLFAPTWSDVEWAERMRRDREEDRRNGRPWNMDEDQEERNE